MLRTYPDRNYGRPTDATVCEALLRLLYAYLTGMDRKDALNVEIPLHTVIKITWGGWQELAPTPTLALPLRRWA